MKPFILIALTTLLNTSALAAPAAPEAKSLAMAPKAGELKFLAVASPGSVKINGTGAAPEGRIDFTELKDKIEVSGSLKMKLDTFTTGLSLRDSHMKNNYLEVSKFPEAQLTLSKQALPKSGSGPFEGHLVLHGVPKKITGTAETKLENGKAQIKASFKLKLTDHGIAQPSFAGVTVADEVSVETDFQAASLN
jgi:polyisoprenoid-binding protein YceI